MKSTIELVNTLYSATFVKKEFELYFSNPEEKDEVVDKFHGALGVLGYTFAVENLKRPCGITIKLTIMQIGNDKKKNIYKNRGVMGLQQMRRILCFITKEMGYSMESHGFEGLQGCGFLYTVIMSKD